jgi:hypothetical protein
MWSHVGLPTVLAIVENTGTARESDRIAIKNESRPPIADFAGQWTVDAKMKAI